jgi:tetratricopeptide (TPR) repeat protein
MHKLRYLAVLPCLLLLAGICHAQSNFLDLPLQSQHAVVIQRIGLTDITINYHRPLVNGRKIWGGLEPYGKVWRAGANVNTTITFSDPVTVEGKPLARGTYGLHMIPGEDQWTVIFSNASTSWGSFSYDPAEDALRVTVKAVPAEFHEALTCDFDNLKDDSAVATFRWEKIAVPFKIAVNVNEIVEASLRKQLRGLVQYSWVTWNDAADYLMTRKEDLDEALMYIDKSIQMREEHTNLMTKSQVLDAMGRKDEAKKYLDMSLEKANAAELYQYARQLQAEKRNEEAYAIFRECLKKYPNSSSSHTGMARVYSAQGDFENALKEAKLALAMSPENLKKFNEAFVKRLEAKEDINK